MNFEKLPTWGYFALLLLSCALPLSAQSPVFFVEDALAAPGEEVSVNVRCVNTDMIAGVQLSLGWDTLLLEYVGVENIALDGSLGENFNQVKLDSGRIGYLEVDAGLNPLPLADSSILFTLRFRPHMNAGTVAEIAFGDDPVRTKASDEMAESVDVVTQSGFVDLGTLAALDRVAESNRFVAAPNPFTDRVRLTLESSYRSAATLDALGLDGRLLLRRSIQVRNGRNQYQLTASDLPAAGSYLIKITTDREQLYRKVLYRRGGR